MFDDAVAFSGIFMCRGERGFIFFKIKLVGWHVCGWRTNDVKIR